MAHHRTLADELRRVLTRLGGAPEVNAVEPALTGSHGVDLCAAATAAPPLLLDVAATAVAAPGADLPVTRPPSPTATPRWEDVGMGASAGAVRVALPDAVTRTGRTGAVVRPHHVPPAPAHAAPHDVPLVRVTPHDGAVPVARDPRARAERPLPRALPARVRPVRPDGPLFTTRRHRAEWANIDRRRLALAWQRMLADHGLPGDDLKLVGLYGPVPLGLVAGVALEPDGRIALRLARARQSGVPGDVVLARHEPTGRLLRVDVAPPPPAQGPAAGRHRRRWN